MIFKNKRLAFESSCYNRVQYNNITYIIYKARNILRVLYILLHHLHNYLYIPVPNLHLNYICHIRFCILYFMLGFMLEDMTCTFFMYHIIYYIYIYIYIYTINLQTAAVSLFESSSVQLRSNENLEGPECSNYCQSCERCISLEAENIALRNFVKLSTLLNKRGSHKRKTFEFADIQGTYVFMEKIRRAYRTKFNIKRVKKKFKKII